MASDSMHKGNDNSSLGSSAVEEKRMRPLGDFLDTNQVSAVLCVLCLLVTGRAFVL